MTSYDELQAVHQLMDIAKVSLSCQSSEKALKINKNGRNKKRWADCETRLRARSDPMMAKRLAASTSNCNPLHYVALSQPSDAQ